MHNAFLPGSFSTQICYFIFYRDISFTWSRSPCLLIVPWWPFADPSESTLLLTASKPQLWTGNHVVVLAMLDPISSDEKKKKKDLFPGAWHHTVWLLPSFAFSWLSSLAEHSPLSAKDRVDVTQMFRVCLSCLESQALGSLQGCFFICRCYLGLFVDAIQFLRFPNL